MDYLDVRINELTNETEEHLLRSSQPHGYLGLVRSLRHGRLGWVVWIAGLVRLGLLVLAIWAGIRFFYATETLGAVKYGLAAATALIIQVQLLVGMTSHLHAERVLRYLKRVEILVLAQRDRN